MGHGPRLRARFHGARLTAGPLRRLHRHLRRHDPQGRDALVGDRTTVGGATAAWFGDNLYWNVVPGRVLSVSLENVTGVDVRAQVRRIADSVTADTTLMRVPFSLNGDPTWR